MQGQKWVRWPRLTAGRCNDLLGAATLAKSLVDRLSIAVAKALRHHVLEATHSDAHLMPLPEWYHGSIGARCWASPETAVRRRASVLPA